ncbi:zinc finger HIT domain-containing protein 2 [Sabethes cyaneus]|uniref:zinc finger HIT domain-containing protein 2 n=1 Tax=Sabethes cyaneus TaxID=53552 RepID=UPI00237E01E9|nr:zinc finger HIT domain-containing protein 2 [Sabethes cyaneus]
MEQEEICKICNVASSKYCCPRCNILYCSLGCYKSAQHEQCSESFYRENVIQEMAMTQNVTQQAAAGETSQSMVEILKRLDGSVTEWNDDDDNDDSNCLASLEEIDSDDDDEETVLELADRLEGVNFDDADAIWERLTDEERKEFQGMLENGDISKILPEIIPWWLRDYKVELIQPSGNDDTSEGEKFLLEQCPAIRTNVTDVTNLSSKTPSPLIKFNLINILAGYSFLYRYFNGDFDGCTQEAANILISISGNLKANNVYDSEAIAVKAVCHDCQVEHLPSDEDTSRLLSEDVRALLRGPPSCGAKHRKHFLLAALSDIRRLFGQAKTYSTQKVLKAAVSESEGSKGAFSTKYNNADAGHRKNVELAKLKACLKKIDYMLAYVQYHM